VTALGRTRTAVARSVKSGSTLTVNVDGYDITVQCARDLTPAINDVLLLQLTATGWVALARLYTAAVDYAPDAYPAPPPTALVRGGRLVLFARSTGSYRDGKWRTDSDDVVQGATGGYGNSVGAAFYGTKPTSLAGATVTAAALTLVRYPGAPYASLTPTMRLATETDRPTGTPTLTSTSAGPAMVSGQTVSWTVPPAWAQAMVNGTAGGIAVYNAAGTPYVRLRGRATNSSAFTLTIDWERA
jgi:hypothetical protein